MILFLCPSPDLSCRLIVRQLDDYAVNQDLDLAGELLSFP